MAPCPACLKFGSISLGLDHIFIWISASGQPWMWAGSLPPQVEQKNFGLFGFIIIAYAAPAPTATPTIIPRIVPMSKPPNPEALALDSVLVTVSVLVTLVVTVVVLVGGSGVVTVTAVVVAFELANPCMGRKPTGLATGKLWTWLIIKNRTVTENATRNRLLRTRFLETFQCELDKRNLNRERTLPLQLI